MTAMREAIVKALGGPSITVSSRARVTSATGPVIVRFDPDSEPRSWQSVIEEALTSICQRKNISATDVELDAARTAAVLEVVRILGSPARRGQLPVITNRQIETIAAAALGRVLRITHPSAVVLAGVFAAVMVIVTGVFAHTGWTELITDSPWPDGTRVESLLRAGSAGTTAILQAAAALAALGLLIEALSVWTTPPHRRSRTPGRYWLFRSCLWVAALAGCAAVAVTVYRIGTFAVFYY